MKISKTILLSLVCMSILIIHGCTTAPITSYSAYTLKVTSNPEDAEVYLDDRLVGKTPCYNVPIFVDYVLHDSYFEPHYVTRELKEQRLLRVSKEGYKDAVEPIKFIKKGSWDSAPKPLKTNYHFELEKEE